MTFAVNRSNQSHPHHRGCPRCGGESHTPVAAPAATERAWNGPVPPAPAVMEPRTRRAEFTLGVALACRPDPQIGGCPSCGSSAMGYVDGRHFGYCDRHRVLWSLDAYTPGREGPDLTPAGRADQERYDEYAHVEPITGEPAAVLESVKAFIQPLLPRDDQPDTLLSAPSHITVTVVAEWPAGAADESDPLPF